MSSTTAAATHVPTWTTVAKSNPQAPSNEWQGRQIGNLSASSSGMFGAQKRPRSDSFEGQSKKPKVSYAPRLGKISAIIYYEEFLLNVYI